MEDRKAYLSRIYSFVWQLPPERRIETVPGLLNKVDPSGKMLHFYGNTTVFKLPEAVHARLKEMQDALYAACGSMLAEPLVPSTFHATLHDLHNGPAANKEAVINAVQPVNESMQAICREIQAQNRSIRLCSNGLFSMVGTSIVLGLEPADEDSWNAIMEWYGRFQEAKPLDYPLTLHITLAYYRPGVYWGEQFEALERLAAACKADYDAGKKLEFTLNSADLAYQTFTSMNHYQDGGFTPEQIGG